MVCGFKFSNKDCFPIDCYGHGGLSDAKRPSNEAGIQKTTSALLNGTACGNVYVAAGLLGTDEIFSPIQMIFDNELVGSLHRLTEGFETDENGLANETIIEEGPGAFYPAAEHTVMNYREALWVPVTWSSSMFPAWDLDGRKSDVDNARETYISLMHNSKPLQYLISEDVERKLLEIINRTN